MQYSSFYFTEVIILRLVQALLELNHSRYRASQTCSIALRMGDADGVNFSIPAQAREDTFATIRVESDEIPDRNALERATLDLITHIPQKEVVHFC